MRSFLTQIVVSVFAGLFLFFSKAYAEGYTLLEPLPGLGGPQTVASYVPVVIRLGIVLAALLAVVVIIIAGFMYITSAGNTGKLEKAKTLVFDAIIGLLIAVGYWLILQAINPAILGGDIGLDSFPDGQVVDVPDSGPTHGVGGPGGEGPEGETITAEPGYNPEWHPDTTFDKPQLRDLDYTLTEPPETPSLDTSLWGISGLGEEGDSCSYNTNCDAGLLCQGGVCVTQE